MGRRRGYNPYASRPNEGGNGPMHGARGKYAKCCCFFLFKCLLAQHYCRTMGLVWQILQGRRASITSACRHRPLSLINLLTRVGPSEQQELGSSLTNVDPFAKWHRTSHLSCWDWWGQINFIKVKSLFALMTALMVRGFSGYARLMQLCRVPNWHQVILC